MSFRAIVSLIVCLVALSALSASAQRTDCLIGYLDLYDDADTTQLAHIAGSYVITDYPVTISYPFTNGHGKFRFSLSTAITRSTNISWSVNGGAFESQTVTPPTTQAFELSGLTPLTGCTVTNDIFVIVNQPEIHPIPGRVDTCTYTYNYVITSSSGSACGDPQFVGLRGQSYQIHGIDGGIYNLISAKEYAVNSRFAFLTGPRDCPVMPSTGKKSSSCWSHDGSYLSNAAVSTVGGENILIQSGSASQGFSELSVNNRPLSVGDSVSFSVGSLFVNSTHEATLQIGVFYMEIENIDGFVNLRRIRVAQADFQALTQDNGVHGLIGQTWRNRRYSGRVPEIEGSPDDYVIESDTMFGTNFIFSRTVARQ